MLTAALPSPIGTKRHSLGRMMTASTLLLLVTIGTLIVVLALIIAFHQNVNATKGYRMRSLERERSQLLIDQEVLNMELAKSQALKTLENDALVLTMTVVRNPAYEKIDPAVAQR